MLQQVQVEPAATFCGLQASSCPSELPVLPVLLAVHGGRRPNAPTDATLWLLAAASTLQGLFTQFGDVCHAVHMTLWVRLAGLLKRLAGPSPESAGLHAGGHEQL